MFFGGSSATFSVRTSFLVCVRRFTLEFGGPVARLLQIGACFCVKYPAVVSLKAPFRFAQQLVLHGGGDHALTRGLQLVLQTVLILLGLVELLHGLVFHREQHVDIQINMEGSIAQNTEAR